MSRPSNKVLVVDDDSHIREVVSYALIQADYDVVEASDGKKGLEAFKTHCPDLVVLDNMMPEMDGIDFCRTVRQTHATPILFLSAKGEEIDRIIGLEVGGDDYITKPFSPRELVARVKARLRNRPTQQVAEVASSADDLAGFQLDLDSHQASYLGHDLNLTLTEFGLLRCLMSEPGRVFNRAALMSGAYEISRIVSDRTIDSHIRRLRKKLAAVDVDPIITLHGIGYKFLAPQSH